MILVGRLFSPFVRRSAILLDLLGVPFELRPLSASADQQALRAFNPVGRVPALIDGERVLIDSLAIALTLCDRHDPGGRFWPKGGPALAEALQTLMLANGALEKFIAGYYERRNRPPEKLHEPWIAQCRDQARGGLAALEQSAAVARRAEADGTPDVVDIALATMTSFLPQIDAGFHSTLDHPRLETIRSRCEAHEAFRRHPILP